MIGRDYEHSPPTGNRPHCSSSASKTVEKCSEKRSRVSVSVLYVYETSRGIGSAQGSEIGLHHSGDKKGDKKKKSNRPKKD